jgi:hypothetical protein
MRVVWGLCFTALCLRAQSDDLLSRFQERIRENLLRQPNYTCIETVERTRQAIGGGRQVDDTLRLEVALVGEKEMFAWPGSRQFEETEISELVTTGMFGNGNFALYTRMLFFGGPPFLYAGEKTISGRIAAQYDFRVPRNKSGYQLRVDGRKGVAGYHGSFYVDPESLDLRRLEIIADDIPPELGLNAAESSVDYGRVPIGDEQFLLPVASTLMMAADTVDRNRIRFTACRKFTGESTLVFDDPEFAAADTPASAAAAEVTLPSGAVLELALRTAIDLKEGAAGDLVDARLNSALKDGRQVIAPKGAVARGRIVRLERHEQQFVLDIKFSDLDWPGGHAKLDLEFERAGLMQLRDGPGVFRKDPSGAIVIDRRNGARLQNIVLFWSTRP